MINKLDYYNIDPIFVDELFLLQTELLKLQKYIYDNSLRMIILFEGRDTAGKGSGISRFTQFLNPQSYNVVALGKPTKREKGQWYFQRYLKRLPDPGEMVFFDRSWYNRAVVDPVMGFCTSEQYDQFMRQINPLETMLIDDGIYVVKFWFSISAEEQKARIQKRLDSPLERWKVSPVDLAAQEKWEEYTKYKNRMFNHTSTELCPWHIVKDKRREERRIQAMRYVLSLIDYDDKSSEVKLPNESSCSIWKKL